MNQRTSPAPDNLMPAEFRVGERIECLAMPGDPAPVEPGTCGRITAVNRYPDWVQYYTEWDNGRTLSACVPPDQIRRARR
jgi:hypothetical protein